MNLLLKSVIKRYYGSVNVPPPPKIEEREFGVGTYDKKIAFRHLFFRSEREFRRYLVEKAPPYISYSIAYFERPGAPTMEEKGFKGADLVFEFDADELGIQSEKDIWFCENCKRGWSEKVTGCPNCGGKVSLKMFPDQEREKQIKENVDTLIKDFLISDFGFSEREISINFSGNRGYHIHVRGETVKDLDKDARIELVQYITGSGINPRFFFKAVSKYTLRGPKPGDPGWRGRIARSAIKTHPELKDAIERGEWPLRSRTMEKTIEYWIKIAKKYAPYAGKKIDAQTSTDIHRLIRVPETIHGGTGLVAKRVKNLWRFDPYREALSCGREPHVKLRVYTCPEFEFGGECFGPYDNSIEELPLHVSVYLTCKGVAEWI